MNDPYDLNAVAERQRRALARRERCRGKPIEALVGLQLTQRELRLLEFGAWRIMNAAYAEHERACVKRPNAVDDAEAQKRAKLFWKDAQDAEALVGKLRALLTPNAKISGVSAA